MSKNLVSSFLLVSLIVVFIAVIVFNTKMAEAQIIEDGNDSVLKTKNLLEHLAISDIGEAKCWGYQLQNAEPAELAASQYDVIVIDYSRDGTDAGAYTPEEIQSIKDTGKIVLSYLSIGEAEDYRFYWKDWWRPGIPRWLGPENPDWPGNYKVRYWHPGWWKVAIEPYLERIIAAGFDGVYMDIIDAYWYWHEEFNYPPTFTANRMVKLVNKIGNYTRFHSKEFILCPQNAESIIDDASMYARNLYLNIIDAIGVEDLFYNYGTPDDQIYRLQKLQEFASAGKKVFNIEYVGEESWAEYLYFVSLVEIEIIPYAGDPDRALDELIDFPCPRIK